MPINLQKKTILQKTCHSSLLYFIATYK